MGDQPAKRGRGDESRPAKLRPDSLFHGVRGKVPPSQSGINGRLNPRLAPVQPRRSTLAPSLLLTSEFDFWMSLSGCGSSPRKPHHPLPHPHHPALSSRRPLLLPASLCECLHSARLHRPPPTHAPAAHPRTGNPTPPPVRGRLPP